MAVAEEPEGVPSANRLKEYTSHILTRPTVTKRGGGGVRSGASPKPTPLSFFGTDTVGGGNLRTPCLGCAGPHAFFRCPHFERMDTYSRRASARKLNACFKCLNSNTHNSKECNQRSLTCWACESPEHNTLLHVDDEPGPGPFADHRSCGHPGSAPQFGPPPRPNFGYRPSLAPIDGRLQNMAGTGAPRAPLRPTVPAHVASVAPTETPVSQGGTDANPDRSIQATNVVSFNMGFKGGSFPPLVSIKVVNRLNGKMACLMALLDTGCTGMIVSQRCVSRLKVATW